MSSASFSSFQPLAYIFFCLLSYLFRPLALMLSAILRSATMLSTSRLINTLQTRGVACLFH